MTYLYLLELTAEVLGDPNIILVKLVLKLVNFLWSDGIDLAITSLRTGIKLFSLEGGDMLILGEDVTFSVEVTVTTKGIIFISTGYCIYVSIS